MSETDVETGRAGDQEAGTAAAQVGPASDARPAPDAPGDRTPTGARRGVESIPAKVMALLSSFGFTTIILLCLMVITFFGTYAQKDIGLVRAQHEYFDSFFCRIDFGLFGYPDWGIRFPGAFLLLILLTINLVCGGIVRIRWRARNAGILIGHFGIIFLLLAGLVKFYQSSNGMMELHEGRPVSTFVSFHEWEIAIAQQGGDEVVEYLIPDTDLRQHGVFYRAGLPFRLKVERYFDHSQLHQAQGSTDPMVIDGVYLRAATPPDAAPMMVPGAYVTALVDGQLSQRGILWGLENHPWTVVVDSRPWTVSLRKRVMDVPFQLELKKFHRELHPGTSMHRHFSSKVVTIDSGVRQDAHIKMNEPLRFRGFMFSQNSWGPQDGSPPPYYSVLEVSSNPSDQWPKYACYVIAFGMLLHFVLKLLRHIERQRKLQGAVA